MNLTMPGLSFPTRTIKLSRPGLMEAAEDISIVPGHHLVLRQPEAVAASPAIVEVPAVGAVEGLLCKDRAEKGQRHQVLHLQAVSE